MNQAQTQQQPQRIRIFVGTPKDFQHTADFIANLHKTLSQGATAQLELVSGADDFTANAPRYGGWGGWIESVATGVEYDRAGRICPRFDIIFVGPSAEIGKATMQIVSKALHAKKSVYHYDGSLTIKQVSGVSQFDPGNFQSGWFVD